MPPELNNRSEMCSFFEMLALKMSLCTLKISVGFFCICIFPHTTSVLIHQRTSKLVTTCIQFAKNWGPLLAFLKRPLFGENKVLVTKTPPALSAHFSESSGYSLVDHIRWPGSLRAIPQIRCRGTCTDFGSNTTKPTNNNNQPICWGKCRAFTSNKKKIVRQPKRVWVLSSPNSQFPVDFCVDIWLVYSSSGHLRQIY